MISNEEIEGGFDTWVTGKQHWKLKQLEIFIAGAKWAMERLIGEYKRGYNDGYKDAVADD